MNSTAPLIPQPDDAIAALLQPINDEVPTGTDLRSNGVYQAIQDARRADDPSLPMGQWERELKQADWEQVEAMASQALREKSKDLQLALWLLEAQIHRHGLSGIAPALLLIRQLCERYWPHLYPSITSGDLEHRVNLFHWANAKLPTAIRLLPLTRDGERHYTWSDWECALRNHQLHAHGANPSEIEGAEIADIQTALANTPKEQLQRQHHDIDAALDAFAQLDECLEQLCGDEAPSLSGLTGLLEDIDQVIAGELGRRGLIAPKETERGQNPTTSEEDTLTGAVENETDLDGRSEAYRQIALIADYLSQIEPHSPVPALLWRAVEWGEMDAATLYRELFAQAQGQINVFELLGIQTNRENE